MLMKEPNPLYAIREKSYVVVNNSLEFKWRYKSGTHFLIALSNSMKPYSLEAIVNLLSQEGMNDRDILTSAAHKIYAGEENVDLKVFLLKERTFQKDNRVWRLNLQELAKRIPYRIDVFVCEEEEDGSLSVYDAPGEDAAFFLPLHIKCSKRLVTKGLLSKQYFAEVVVGKPEQYIDGTFQYLVPGAGISIPIPERALGRQLMIKLPDARLPMIYASEEYRKYYSIEEN